MSPGMLTQTYIEALANQVQESLMTDEIDETTAFLAWWLILIL